MRERLAEAFNEDMKFLEQTEYDAAIEGVLERFGQPPIACYDRNKIIEIISKRDNISMEEAEEFFEFNIIGAWDGDNTPSFITKKESVL